MQYPTQRDALDFLADDQNADTLRLAIEQLEDQLAEVLDLNEDEIGTGDFSVEALRALAEEIELLERESPLV